MKLEGTVAPGMGRGARYVGMDAYQERFRDALGFAPFPGTLNLRVDPDAKQALEQQIDRHEIDGFTEDGEEFSAVDAYPVLVEGKEAALLEMAITDHPPTVAEIVAPANLRDALDLDDGDTVVCRPR
ncbi:MAG: DUF120 domain-containing protein [Candidatus Nanohaloarchaea archaeon]|nr:DUF120 domain-containing protein [Candidatus Nanohaloarchaea archaeon]